MSAFLDWLKQQTDTLLPQFIDQASTPGSDVSQLFEAIRQNAQAPENNALIAAMSQIDLKKLGIEAP